MNVCMLLVIIVSCVSVGSFNNIIKGCIGSDIQVKVTSVPIIDL